MNEINQVFTKAYNECKRDLPFNPEWSNGTGYFDFAVYSKQGVITAPKLGNGEMARSNTTADGSGRRILIIGTRLGNMVVFDRFTEQGENQKDAARAIFVYNTTTSLKNGGWFNSGALDVWGMEIAVGDGADKNIGWRLEQLASAMKDVVKS